jgi:hypothetical protein
VAVAHASKNKQNTCNDTYSPSSFRAGIRSQPTAVAEATATVIKNKQIASGGVLVCRKGEREREREEGEAQVGKH